jgi:hypothetical protein
MGWVTVFAMKLLLSVGAIALTLTFSAYAEPPNHVALFPDFTKCFDLLRLESLHSNGKPRGRGTGTSTGIFRLK